MTVQPSARPTPDPATPQRLWEFVPEPGKRYVIRTTLVVDHVFDPVSVRNLLGRRDERFEAFEDWVIKQFDKHDGSQFGDSLFYDTARPKYGVELVVEGEDD